MKAIFLFIIVLFATQFVVAQDFTKNTYAELDSLATLYFKKADYQQAFACANTGKERAYQEFGKEDSTSVQFTNVLGVLYKTLGDYANAELNFKEALEIMEKIHGKTHADYLSTLNNLATTYSALGDYNQAVKLYKEGLEIEKKKNGESTESYLGKLGNLATVYDELGDYKEAEKLYKQALKTSQLLDKKTTRYATLLTNVADFYKGLESYEEAENLQREALEIKKEILGAKHPDYALSLNGLATLYTNLNRYEEAKLLLLEALDIYKTTLGEKHVEVAMTLENVATVYRWTKEYTQAEKCFLQALEINKLTYGEEHPAYVRGLAGLGLLYDKMGKYKESGESLLKAQVIVKKVLGDKHSRYANYVNNVGLHYFKMGEYALSEKYYKEGQGVLVQIYGENHNLNVISLNNLSELYAEMGQLDLALAYSMAAIAYNCSNFTEIFPSLFVNENSFENYNPTKFLATIDDIDYSKLVQLKVEDFFQINKSLKNLLKITKKVARLQANSKQVFKQHYQIAKAALEINEGIRNDFSATENKLTLLKENNVLVKYGLDAALSLDETDYYYSAFSFAEQNKSILLADAVKGSRARTLGDLPDSLALLEINLESKKDKLKKALHEATTSKEKSEIIAKENKLNDEIAVFLNAIKNQYPKYHALKYENITATAKDVQRLLDKESLFLEYFVTDSATYLFEISSETVKLHSIKIREEELKLRIKTLHYALSNYSMIAKKSEKAYKLYTEAAYWFYKELVEIAIKNKDKKNIIIVTDGELGHLPFEAFLTEETKNQHQEYNKLHYLVKKYNVSYNYSATLFVESKRSQTTTSKLGNNRILAMAASYPKMDSTLLKLRPRHLYAMRTALNPLPAAHAEIKALSEIFEGDFYWENSVNEHFFKNNVQNYGIVHLAMHGILQPQAPMLSSLAFTENKDSLEDNFLQAYEISRLKMNANLVVLSACETGYGRFEQGEGIISIARSFMYAGVPSLVVSLWQVNDASTASVMKMFYHFLAEGMDKASALRQAKLTYIESTSGIMAHPAFWSPFIQLGDNSPVLLAKKGSWLWLIGLAVFVVMGGGWFLIRKRKKAE